MSDPLLGTLVDGRYELRRLLGTGGTAHTYLARQVGFERSVAVKLLRSKLARDRWLRERFQAEALLASRVSHLNLVRVIDAEVSVTRARARGTRPGGRPSVRWLRLSIGHAIQTGDRRRIAQRYESLALELLRRGRRKQAALELQEGIDLVGWRSATVALRRLLARMGGERA
jgi:hypothetical protein